MAPPPDGPRTHDEFLERVEKALDKIRERLEQAIADVANEANVMTFVKWAKWVSPPLFLLEYAIEKLAQNFDELWKHFEKMVKDVMTHAKSVTGDPPRLMELHGVYTDARKKLAPLGSDIDSVKWQVSKGWSGDAYIAFTATSNEQQKAVAAVDGGLKDAATAVSDSADEIVQLWLTIIGVVLDNAEKIAEAVAEGTDVGKIVTLDIGPAVEAMAHVAVAIAKVLNEATKALSKAATIGTGKWDALEAIPDLREGNGWPAVRDEHGSDLATAGDWTHK